MTLHARSLLVSHLTLHTSHFHTFTLSLSSINLVHLSSVSIIMEPNEEDFRIFLYDYLQKKGLTHTAEIFRYEAQVNGPIPHDLDYEPHGFLYDFWTIFYDLYKSRMQQRLGGPSNPISVDDPEPDVGAVMNTTPQKIPEGYSIQQLCSFRSDQTLLSIDISSDGKIVASGGVKNKPFIINTETGGSFTASDSHASTILEVRFLPGSNIFATSSVDKTVKVWDAGRPERVLASFVGHDERVISLDCQPSGGIICSSDTSDVLKVWDLRQLVMINSHTQAGGSRVRFQPGSGKYLAVAKGNVITIFDFQASKFFIELRGHVKDIKSICWDVTGQTIASVSEDDVRVWSVFEDGKCTYAFPSNGKSFLSVIFHPRYYHVLVIGGYQYIELLVLENNRTVSERASDISITGVAATTAPSQLIASASNDSVVKIWK